MRRENWRPALIDYIDQQAREPFAYGVNDCLLVVAGAVEVMTGVDHAADYRGRYTSLAEAKKLIGKPLIRFVGDLYPKYHPSNEKISDGDIAAIRQGREWTFGIIIGAFVYVQMEVGMGIKPRSDAAHAFRVT